MGPCVHPRLKTQAGTRNFADAYTPSPGLHLAGEDGVKEQEAYKKYKVGDAEGVPSNWV